LHKARFYQKEEDQVRCLLCPRQCLIAEDKEGTCGVRRVTGGELYTLNYGQVAAANHDPIEKKPLYHFYPGFQILSLGTFGCNLLCSFCQNWSLSRAKPGRSGEAVAPEDVLKMLERKGGPKQAPGVAYTYNEPVIWYEFVYDTARLLHEHGYKNILVTNGYINPDPLKELLPYIDAMNIDVKAYNDSFYRQYCRGEREAVINSVEMAVKNCHVEVTCLLIPGLNDNIGEQENLARWLGSLDPDLVLHYSRYFPQYKLEAPPTPPEVMEQVKAVAEEHLRYVFLGNIDLPGTSDSICPHCGNLLIARSIYRVRLVGMEGPYCNNCGNRLGIVTPDG